MVLARGVSPGKAGRSGMSRVSGDTNLNPHFNLAMTGTPNGIAALVAAHEKYAGGATQVLYADDNLRVQLHPHA